MTLSKTQVMLNQPVKPTFSAADYKLANQKMTSMKTKTRQLPIDRTENTACEVDNYVNLNTVSLFLKFGTFSVFLTQG